MDAFFPAVTVFFSKKYTSKSRNTRELSVLFLLSTSYEDEGLHGLKCNIFGGRSLYFFRFSICIPQKVALPDWNNDRRLG